MDLYDKILKFRGNFSILLQLGWSVLSPLPSTFLQELLIYSSGNLPDVRTKDQLQNPGKYLRYDFEFWR